MEGSRKIKGYYVATTVLTISYWLSVGFAAFFQHLSIDLTQTFNMYLLAEGSVTAVFFGMNGVEHWTKTKINGDSEKTA